MTAQEFRAAVPAGAVRWGHELTDAEPRPGGGYRLEFPNGTAVTCDLLVGDDGARSRVRPLLTDARAGYQYSYVELGTPDADRTAPDVAAMVGPGSLRGLGDNLNLMAQRDGDGRIRVSVSARADEGWFDRHGVDPADPAGTRARLRAPFAGWDRSLVAMLDATDDRIVPRAIMATPVEVGWTSRPGVTLIGDAAHLMPPAGEGANQAMLDGAELALAIAAARPSPDGPLTPAVLAAAVRDYEAAMFPRASAAAAESAAMERIGLAPNAAENLARMLG